MRSDAPRRGRLLLIEDEVLVAMLLEDIVIDLGWGAVGPFARVDKALTALADNEVDAAVLDVNLAGETSYPIAEALAARNVPFVFVTGYGQSGLDPKFSDRPVLQKPFTEQTLGRALDQLMAGKTAMPLSAPGT